MATIDVDFEVFKALTALREAENDTYNAVLRRLLHLPPVQGHVSEAGSLGCLYKGVWFPEGTLFRVTYKGRTFEASIRNGIWTDSGGIQYSSPSKAAFAVTGSNVNGWRFWSCKRPHDSQWTRLDELR